MLAFVLALRSVLGCCVFLTRFVLEREYDKNQSKDETRDQKKNIYQDPPSKSEDANKKPYSTSQA